MLNLIDNLLESYIKIRKPYLSIVAILKNEASYIKEWIEYHRLVGVSKFYLYDNDSTDNVYEILKPYIDKGIVVYIKFPGSAQQHNAYNDAINKYKYETKWLAIIDLDEFIVPVETKTIPDFLKKFEKNVALGVNWLMFDYNNHEQKPEGLVIENYTRVAYEFIANNHIKSIVNPRQVTGVQTPHSFYYKNNQLAVNENYENLDWALTKNISFKKIRINHYHCKSREEYMIKLERGNADKLEKRPFNIALFDFGNTNDTLIIDKYLTKLKERLEING